MNSGKEELPFNRKKNVEESGSEKGSHLPRCKVKEEIQSVERQAQGHSITGCNCKKMYDRKTSAELSLKRTPAESKCVHSALEYYGFMQPDSD